MVVYNLVSQDQIFSYPSFFEGLQVKFFEPFFITKVPKTFHPPRCSHLQCNLYYGAVLTLNRRHTRSALSPFSILRKMCFFLCVWGCMAIYCVLTVLLLFCLKRDGLDVFFLASFRKEKYTAHSVKRKLCCESNSHLRHWFLSMNFFTLRSLNQGFLKD